MYIIVLICNRALPNGQVWYNVLRLGAANTATPPFLFPRFTTPRRGDGLRLANESKSRVFLSPRKERF